MASEYDPSQEQLVITDAKTVAAQAAETIKAEQAKKLEPLTREDYIAGLTAWRAQLKYLLNVDPAAVPAHEIIDAMRLIELLIAKVQA